MFRARNKSKLNETGAGRKVGLALLAVALAMGVHGAFLSFLPKQFPFLPFAAAVLIASRWAGGVGGVTATIASAFILRLWILPPGEALLDERNLGMWLFLAAGGCVSWQAFMPTTTDGVAKRREDAPVRSAEPAAVAAAAPVEVPMFEYTGANASQRRAA